MTYDYLKKYVLEDFEKLNRETRNWFCPVSRDEIQEAEKRLGFVFPSQLRTFYEEIGYGALTTPHDFPPDYSFCNANYIFSPKSLASLMLEGAESESIMETTFELLQPGDLPFFEIGDSTRFLLMKLSSDNPNAVWHQGRRNFKVEDSLERFIYRLYYEDPGYYDDMLDAYLASLKK